jgi:Zn-finger nucleic acid-binding protein
MRRFAFEPRQDLRVELDACEKCFFIWFDRGELKHGPGLQAERIRKAMGAPAQAPSSPYKPQTEVPAVLDDFGPEGDPFEFRWDLIHWD